MVVPTIILGLLVGDTQGHIHQTLQALLLTHIITKLTSGRSPFKVRSIYKNKTYLISKGNHSGYPDQVTLDVLDIYTRYMHWKSSFAEPKH